MADLSRRAALLGLATSATVAAAPAGPDAWAFEFPSIDEGALRLSDLRGRVLLVTNTASFCGFTPQYETLEATHAALRPRGFAVVGVPSQDFGQESGSNGEVKAFCEATWGVEFPMAGLSHVRGPEAHPFYRWVRAERGWEPSWNFCKVLIGRDGRIAGTFQSADTPDGAKVRGAIERLLAA